MAQTWVYIYVYVISSIINSIKKYISFELFVLNLQILQKIAEEIYNNSLDIFPKSIEIRTLDDGSNDIVPISKYNSLHDYIDSSNINKLTSTRMNDM